MSDSSRMQRLFSWIHELPVKEVYTSLIAILLALCVGAILLLAAGVDPLSAYYRVFVGALGNASRIGAVASKAVPLLLASLGILLAFRCKVWNIGAEGQILLGGLGATIAALTFGDLPAVLMIPLVIASAFAFGGLWGLIPGLLKVTFKVNELFTTLMMNFIAVLLIAYLVNGPLQDPTVTVPLPQSEAIPISARLPILIPKTNFHSGIFIGIAVVFLVYMILFRMPFGYRIRAIGENPEAARYGGINVSRNVFIVMILSAGIVGLAGMVEVTGVQYRLKEDFSGGLGYVAILVSLLGRDHPFGVLFAAFFFAIMDTGVRSMAGVMNVPTALSLVLEALVMFFLIGSEIVLTTKGKTEKGGWRKLLQRLS